MVQTEYIRSMQCNYERVLLDKQPEENRYQYCILSRGGIKGLLPCSLRYLNGLAYLYYDITSKQSVAQLYGKRCIARNWVKDFVWSFKRIQTELSRFLLDERNILWYPEQIFQDLENNIFSFLYIPYYEGENGFLKFLEYLVEHIDYEDEILVECVYKMYEQYERNGETYLQAQFYEDAKILNEEQESHLEEKATQTEEIKNASYQENIAGFGTLEQESEKEVSTEKKGLRYLFEGKRRKNKEVRENYRRNMQFAMDGCAVAEDTVYAENVMAENEEYGKTVYIDESRLFHEITRRLYTADGRILMQLNQEVCIIGKKKGEVDLVLEDFTVSRMHARIIKNGDEVFIEDLNSTNGTYKNGLQMQPYEKKKLEEGDEIKIGKVVLIYR
uniref:DUF6382 domain-containing protein n=1 Tax=Acetatifactor sp. TaxID=1872090 RepID=UPI004056F8A5